MTRILFILAFTVLGVALLAASSLLTLPMDREAASGMLAGGLTGGLLCFGFAGAIVLGGGR